MTPPRDDAIAAQQPCGYIKDMRQWFSAVVGWCGLILLALVVMPAAADACPGCKDALAAANNALKTPFDADPAATAEMFSWTVLLMLGTVAGIFAGFAGGFYWMVRQAAVKQSAAVTKGNGSASCSGSSPAGDAAFSPVRPTIA